MKNNRIIGLFGWSTALLLFCSCSAPKPPQFRGIDNLQISDVTTDSATVALDIKYFNPNSFSLAFKKLSCDVFADDNFIGHYQVDTTYKLVALKDDSYPMQVRIGIRPILKNAVSMLLNGGVNLHFKGTAKVGRGGFFISIPIDYAKKQKISF